MDHLQAAAIAYQALLSKEYHLSLGFKGKKTEIQLTFQKTEFKHLTGVQKLVDTVYPQMPADLFFEESLCGSITCNDLEASCFYLDMRNRLEQLKYLEFYLDANMQPFGWDLKRVPKGISRIHADYLLCENSALSEKAYIFLKERFSTGKKKTAKIADIHSHQHSISFFVSPHNYARNQVRYTLLLNRKIQEGAELLLYDFAEEKKKK